MDPIRFDGVNVTLAENQLEYIPLPACRYPDGRLVFCWRLTLRERLTLLLRGVLWHQVLTFNKPLQPQMVSVECPLTPPEVR